MIRFLLLVGIVITATYMLAPPRFAAIDGSNSAEANTRDAKPLLTSWGRTLQSLRHGPRVARAEPRGLGEDPRQAAQLMASSTQGASGESSQREDFHTYGQETEFWVLGQSNGWVKHAEPVAEERGWASDQYLAAANNRPIQTRSAVKSATPKKPKADVRVAARDADAAGQTDPRNVAKRKEAEPRRVAAAHSPFRRALFARKNNSTSSDGDRGFFGLFKSRKAERRAWAVAPPQ